MNDLDTLLRSADPGRTSPHARDAAERLAATAPLLATTAPDDRSAGRRVTRPVLVTAVGGALVLTGGLAVAAPSLLDLFGAGSPVVETVELEVPGGSCSVFLNVVPADGAVHADSSGGETSGGSAETFDQAEFDAVEAFLRTHDWSDVMAEAAPFGGTSVTSDGSEGGTVEGSFTSVKEPVEEVLAAHGLNATGSAILVESAECGAGTLP
ncbi:hypothetical protein V5D56_03765 [Cellulosimicrobium sp. PMB13]|uniref:hypothetical protein n=1 Tax=Cellulosimicrobium sp. PMB13 TaxID=3120158 RepID=UPI003F4B7704